MAKFVLTAELKLQAPRNAGQVVNQLQSQLKGLTVNLSVNGSKSAVQQIKQVAQATSQAASSADKMGEAFGVSLKRFTAFSIASRAIGLFTSKLSNAVDEAIAFQNELVRISQVTGKTLGELKGLTDQVTQLSVNFGVSSKEILGVATTLAQAGIAGKDLEVAINALAKTKLAPTFGDIQDTAEGAVAVIAQFGEGVGALERQLGAINRVSADFAVESEDLISVIQRTGGVFKASGGNLEELLALFTSVRATTRESAESIATGLRTIFTRIQRPATIEYLKQFGVELTDIDGKFVGPYEAVKRLSEALSGLGEGDIRFIKIAEELGGFRQIGKVIPLLQKFEVAERARQSALKGGESLDKDVATAQQSLAVQFTKVREEFLALIRSVSETSSFQILVKTSLNLASALIKIADALKPLIPLLATLATIKFAQNIGGFLGGIGAGFSGLKKKNAGGKILAFARGGLVPGSGNGDTVPAMLSPGEFVIRKSSVNDIGADTLSAMNDNKYASGGIVSLGGLASNTKFIDKSGNELGLSKDKYTYSPTKAKKVPISINEYSGKRYGQGGGKGWEKYLSSKGKYGTQQKKPGFPIDFIKGGTLYDAKDKRAPKETSPEFEKEQARKVLNYYLYKKFKNKGYNFTGTKQNIIKGVESGTKINELGLTSKGLTTGVDLFKLPQVTFLYPEIIYEGKGKNAKSSFSKGQKRRKEATLERKRDTIESQNEEFFQQMFVRESNGGLIHKYAEGTIGKGVPEKTPDQIAFDKDTALKNTYQSFNRAAGLKSFLTSDEKRSNGIKRLTSNANVFDIAFLRQVLQRAITSEKQKGESLSKLPQYGAAILKKKNNFKSQLTDTSGRQFGLTTLYMGADDSKHIQDSIIKDGAEKLINDTATYMNKGIGGSLLSGGVSNLSGITGSIFEAALRKIDDLSGDGDPDKLTFDYPNGLGPNAIKLFGADAAKLAGLKTDAKFSSSDEARDSIRRKVNKDLNEKFGKRGKEEKGVQKGKKTKKYASGGLAESDTVPALLTPGEFVFNRDAAQSIGYGNLNRMNKQGVTGFAKGGPVGVQKFANGDKVQKAETDDTKQSDVGKLVGLSSLASLPAIIDQLAGPVNDTSSGLRRVVDAAGDVVTTMATLGIALEVFGLKLTKASAGKLFDPKAMTQLFQKKLPGGNNINTIKSVDRYKNIIDKMNDPKNFQALNAQNHYKTEIANLTSRQSTLSVGTNKKDATAFFKMQNQIEAWKKEIEDLQPQVNVESKQLKSLQTRKAGWEKRIPNIADMATGKIPMPKIGSIQTILPKVLGALSSLATGAAAGALAFQGVAHVMDSYMNLQNKLNKAIEQGDAAQAETIAVQKAAQDSINTAGTALTASFAGIGAVIGGPLGAAVGAGFGILISGLTKATVGLLGLEEFAINVGTFFGGPTLDSVKSLAQAQALAGKYTKDFAENARKASYAMEEIEAGRSTFQKEFSNGTLTKNLTNAAKSAEAAQKASNDQLANKSTGGFSTARDIFSLGGTLFESSNQRNMRIDEENKKRNKEAADTLQKEFDDLRPSFRGLAAEMTVAGKTQADFLAIFGDKLKGLSDEQLQKLKDDFDNQSKATKENIEYLNSLNFGLRDVRANLGAASVALDYLTDSAQTGANSYNLAARQLEASISEAAISMNPQDIANAQQKLADTLAKSGATPKQVQQAQGAFQTLTTAQKEAKGVLTGLSQRKDLFGKAGSAVTIKDELQKALSARLKASGASDSDIERLNRSFGNLQLTPEMLGQIQEGNIDSVITQVFGPMADALSKEFISIAKERGALEQKLIDLTRKRIDAESNFVQAQKQAIDIQLEAKKAIEEFGGPLVTSKDKIQALNEQLNLDLDLAGAGTVGGGTAADFSAALNNIQSSFRTLEMTQATSIATTGGGAFLDAAGVEADKRQQLENSMQSLVDGTRKRLELVREEIEIAKKKNSLEKSAIEKLIGGDVQGFIEQQTAAAAASLMRTGNTQLLGMFSGSALGAGLQSLEGQGLSKQQMESAANAVLSRFGGTQRMAQVFAGTTPEEKALMQQGQQYAGVLNQAGQSLADMQKMKLTTAEMEVNTAILKISNLTGQSGAVNLSNLTGGTLSSGAIRNNAPATVANGGVPAVSGPGARFTGNISAGIPQAGASTGFGIGQDTLSALTTVFNNFATSVDKLQNTKFLISLDPTNININFNGTSFLANLKSELQKEVLGYVAAEIPKYTMGNDGTMRRQGGVV